MRQSQAEIKAIEAELRSIRADKAVPHSRSVTLLEPGQSESRRSEFGQSESVQPISPIIQRSVVEPSSQQIARPAKPAQKRSVECFPLPHANSASNSALDTQIQTAIEQLQQSRLVQANPTQVKSTRLSASSASVQRFKQVQAQFLENTAERNRDTVRHLLAEKAKRINDLSTQQEMMILELMKISDQLERDFQNISSIKQTTEPICEYIAAEVPYVETDRSGTLILTTRSIDSFDAENESAAIAESLRHRARKYHRSLLYRIGQTVWQLTWNTLRVVGTIAGFATAPIRWLLLGRTSQATIGLRTAPRRKVHRSSSRKAAETPFTLKTALILMAGSALLRMALDWIVASYPMLWLPSILVMLMPAVIALYRSTVAPQGGFSWSYRLFAIMIGLLLGGRLL
jgi:hypothetical protein